MNHVRRTAIMLLWCQDKKRLLCTCFLCRVEASETCAVPEEGTIHYGGMDYGVRKEFDILEWIFSHGYPKSIYEECGGQFYCKYWTLY